MPPMGFILGNNDHTVSDKSIRYYGERADGGVGLIIVEYTAVHPQGAAEVNQLGLWDDSYIDGMEKLVKRIHQGGAKAAIQLHHGGRTGCEKHGPALAPSAIAGKKGIVPKEMTHQQIDEVVNSFADAAKRAVKAGFDAIEIHGAHGYLLAQFMSGFANKRTDEYGGDMHGYLKLPIRVIKAVRDAIGDDLPLIFRISAEEGVENGRDLPQTLKMAPYLVEAGLDMFHVTAGTTDSGQFVIPPMTVKKGVNLDAASKVKSTAGIPVIVVGRINDSEIAELALKDYGLDLVAMGRALIADPQFPYKVNEDKLDEVRYCIGCSDACLSAPPGKHCSINPRAGREYELSKIKPGQEKNIVVVGGGPAGMEAAATAAENGHEVTLLEAGERLGGQLLLAAKPPQKDEILNFIHFEENRLKQLGVNIRLNCSAEVNLINELKPDLVLIATGSKPSIPDLPGKNEFAGTIVDARRALENDELELGNKVLVVGGGLVGTEVACWLSSKGKNVVIVEVLPEICNDVPPVPMYFLKQKIDEYGIEIYTDAEIKGLNKNKANLKLVDQEIEINDIDSIIFATGAICNNELYQELSSLNPDLTVKLIGDADNPGRIKDAVNNAFDIAITI